MSWGRFGGEQVGWSVFWAAYKYGLNVPWLKTAMWKSKNRWCSSSVVLKVCGYAWEFCLVHKDEWTDSDEVLKGRKGMWCCPATEKWSAGLETEWILRRVHWGVNSWIKWWWHHTWSFDLQLIFQSLHEVWTYWKKQRMICRGRPLKRMWVGGNEEQETKIFGRRGRMWENCRGVKDLKLLTEEIGRWRNDESDVTYVGVVNKA